MPTEVTTVLLAGFVALAVTTGIGALMWDQIRRERQRELVAVGLARSLELHRTRLASYPAAFEAMEPLSTQNRAVQTPETAGAVAQRLNVWLYSVGGMCADATTRGALLGLRDSCARWAGVGQRPPQLYEFRNLAVAFLRHDLDLSELDASEIRRNVTLLGRLRDDLDALDNRAGDTGSRLDAGTAAGSSSAAGSGPAADDPPGPAWLSAGI
ncbi:hypothetical protein HC031_15060 [Planosporangium thailandense]|uniref:Secreted protein n=1 Tax=Planosporangium thailandense TaxID=765197 RepID=A0ABX0XYA7_9ACTN|nr:hypothetical protein [Planosporangium thailandense]NJC71023.1 hypothetical protein [Planosporangium thailandense]